jgi:hypothetical protein
MFSADLYLRAMHFAARAHGDQKMLEGLPYVVHLSTVAMELTCAFRMEQDRDEALALPCAILHDVVEDTETRLDQVAEEFGPCVAAGVAALTKNAGLPEERQMRDSIERILQQPPRCTRKKRFLRDPRMRERGPHQKRHGGGVRLPRRREFIIGSDPAPLESPFVLEHRVIAAKLTGRLERSRMTGPECFEDDCRTAVA